MGTRISFVMMLFIGSMPFAIFNLIPFISGWTPQPRHLAASVTASLILLLTGFVMAWKRQRFFLRWHSAYWLLGAVLLSLAVAVKLKGELAFILYLSAGFVYASPLYGLQSFYGLPVYSSLFPVLALTGWLCGMAGYGAGLLAQKIYFQSFSGRANSGKPKA